MSSLKCDFENALSGAFHLDQQAVPLRSREAQPGELIFHILNRCFASKSLKDSPVLLQLRLQELVVEAIGPLGIDTVLEHEEVVPMTDAVLLVPVVGRIHDNRDGNELVALEPPNIPCGHRGGDQILNREAGGRVIGNLSYLDDFVAEAPSYTRRSESFHRTPPQP